MISAHVGVHDHPNSYTSSGEVSRDYLTKKCKRVKEARAREVHPKLFQLLDD